ncbi:hypothetical protein DSO57_1027481 [Entomophthora muscae]|uniref:Uncharacterized protein n=1 Tax=Entomophthora muscae TaxID=34485 RepID=A0ACC2U0I9_9FUNG|nr:hypothetical protein DSO57_1027481 [Entomophthora muscae]
MAFHVNMGNQSQKDKCLPSRATATYQPIKLMNDEEYHQWYMTAITHNPSASTPATPTCQPHPPNPRPLRPALPLHLLSCAILPSCQDYPDINYLANRNRELSNIWARWVFMQFA